MDKTKLTRIDAILIELMEHISEDDLTIAGEARGLIHELYEQKDNIKTDLHLPTLEHIKFMFGLHSDWSTQCNGYRSLIKEINDLKPNNTEEKEESNKPTCEISGTRLLQCHWHNKGQCNKVDECGFKQPEDKVLSKQMAIELALRGEKIAHRSFLDTEWIMINDSSQVVTEDGYTSEDYEFWKTRIGKDWETGWFIFKEEQPKKCPRCEGEMLKQDKEICIDCWQKYVNI